MALQFTENRQRNIGLSLTSNPRTVLRSNGLAEATQAEALAGTIQHRYISPLRLSQYIANEATGDLTKVDDTNVTLTLGGTPTDALWNDVSITAGWSGTLAAARGGWGADISAQSGIPILTTGVAAFFAPAAGVQTFLTTPSSANLATAVTDETGSGALVFATSPTLVTPVLGTPTSGTLTNCTGLPVSTGVSGLGTGVATALAVNVGSAGAPVVNGGALGTPSSGTLTNATGLPISTGVSGLGAGVATFLATPSSANLATAVTGETGSGALVFATSPTLVTPILGTPTSGTLTNCTIPRTGVTGSNALLFSGYLSSNQTPTTGVWTKVQINTEVTDTEGKYDNATNYRYQPTTAGLYGFKFTLTMNHDADNYGGAKVYKNGASIGGFIIYLPVSGNSQVNVFVEADLNGSTDYIEFFGYSTSGTPLFHGGAESTFATASRRL